MTQIDMSVRAHKHIKLAVLTAVCASGWRWKVGAGAGVERDGDPPS